MWWMIGAALAGNFFEPNPIRGNVNMEVSRQTYRTGETWLSGANVSAWSTAVLLNQSLQGSGCVGHLCSKEG